MSHCAHVGIELIGVNRPESSMNCITKKKSTKIACCMVLEILAIVTKDVPANTIVAGNPARVLREITEDDDRYEGGKPI